MSTLKIRLVSARFPAHGTMIDFGHDPAVAELLKMIIPADKRHYDGRSKIWESDLGPDLDRFLAAVASLGYVVVWQSPWLGGAD